jgi:hypothetical protein
MSEAQNPTREFLRHTLATLAYRGGKALRGTTPAFGSFKVGETTRTPIEILAHVGDLLEWAQSLCRGAETWHDSSGQGWDQETQRFHEQLSALDDLLASGAPLHVSAERLFQGPIADALTHVGQIALLRRLDGLPVRGENYFRADIATGRVGPEQAAPIREAG